MAPGSWPGKRRASGKDQGNDSALWPLELELGQKEKALDPAGVFHQKVAEVHDHRVFPAFWRADQNNLPPAGLAGNGQELY